MYKPKFMPNIYTFKKNKKYVGQVCFDLLINILACSLAIIIQFTGNEILIHPNYYLAFAITIVIGLINCFVFEIYKTSLAYLTIEHSFKIVMASFTTSIACCFSLIIFQLDYPLQISILYFNFSFIGLTISRYLTRIIIHNAQFDNRKRVAVYGAGQGGIQLISALKFHSEFKVVTIIDDDPDLQGQYHSGLKILGFEQAVKKILNEKIELVLMALPSIDNKHKAQIIHKLTNFSIPVKTIPNLNSLINGSALISDLKDIDIDDILGRTVIKPIDGLMSKNITDKVILVTGAGGSIGSELCRQILAQNPREMILLDISEFNIYTIYNELLDKNYPNHIKIKPFIGSIQDPELINSIFNTFVIDTVYHAAAYKHVPIVEQNLIQGIKNNVFGTLNMIEASTKAKVSNFILVSTDKAVNPTNYMGATKRLAELICQTRSETSKDTCFTIVRFGNVLGSSGSVVPLFQKQISAGGPVTLTHRDIERYFMTIHEAAQLVIQAGSISSSGEIYVLDMGRPVKILDLAFDLIKLSGLKPYIKNEYEIGGKIEGDIAVDFIGLRPGEKLYEELSYSKNLLKTIHPKIMKSPDISLSKQEVDELLSKLKGEIQHSNYDEIFKTFKIIATDLSADKDSTDIIYNQRLSD